MACPVCGRTHKPGTAIAKAHSHREHPAMFTDYPFQPRCSCGWAPPVFYPDAYLALGHWQEHSESALNAPAAPRQKHTPVCHPVRPAASRQHGKGASPGTPAAGALNA